MKYIIEKEEHKYDLMGGKGAALSKIGMTIDNIPDWFVVSYEGFNIETKEFNEGLIEEVNEKIKNFPDDTFFAVRSSAANEDSKENSFAGQFDTFLYVKKEEVIDRIKDVYMSVFSERIESYRNENNITEILIPSVVIQKQINSEKAGVAFGANPVNSNIKEVLISAVYGLGSSLVDGVATSDTYIVKNDHISKEIPLKDYLHIRGEAGNIKQVEIDEERKNKQVLTDEEIYEVTNLVKKASDFFGRYQDIEWAFEDGKLYLLQSRPITTLGKRKNETSKINVFDNSNIVESYGGITTPLTFSFIRLVYEHVYIELCKIFNVKKEKIEMNSQMFKNMLALIDGRVYYNLYGWYGLLSMFPGIGNNKKFMEQMMGVKESLPDDLFPVPEATFKDKIELISTGCGLAKGFFKIRGMTEKFYERLNDALEKRNIENMDLYELHDYYYELESKLLHKWDAPLVNDFLAMIFYGQLKQKCRQIFKEDGDMIHNDLLCNEGGIISAEPAKRIKELAEIAKDNDELIELLQNPNVLYIKKELPKYLEFNQKLNEYLDKFSDRCLQELKLETETLKDNPVSLYHSISTFAIRMKKSKIETVDSEKARIEAEKKVKKSLKNKPIEKAKFNFILRQARFTVKNRENLRFERTRLFGRVREIFLRVGYILTSMNVIADKRDIFYLEVDEILYYIDGKSTTNNLRELIEIRKKQYNKYKETNPDERFYSYGAVNIGNDFKRENVNTTSETKSELELKGIGASPGIVKGKVRIIKNPSNAKLEQGEILVAEYTDPGWIMLFPAASGILVERGSLLSHSAIVSRELGIPAVVGITGLLSVLNDGDEVELNGTTGIIRKI
ncbi:MAG: phosphoenolpyruvate synthase [Clostridia bacterium]|nr:phosphoenolpyruvate synthase [Clostridia bacterium]